MRRLGRSGSSAGAAVRAAFPIFPRKIHDKRLDHLDNAASIHKPRKVIDDSSDDFIKILEKPFSPKRLKEEEQRALSALKQDEMIHKKFRGVLATLDVALDNLERVLAARQIRNYQSATPQSALEALGQGENYNIFMAWHYLNDLRNKIEKR